VPPPAAEPNALIKFSQMARLVATRSGERSFVATGEVQVNGDVELRRAASSPRRQVNFGPPQPESASFAPTLSLAIASTGKGFLVHKR